MKQSEFRAGAAVTDITPPLEVGLLTSSVNGSYAPFSSIRLPLKARALVLQSGDLSVAIVSLDLLSLTDTSVGGWDNFKQSIAGPISAENIILCYTHTHSAPESGAITDLYQTPAYRSWLDEVRVKVREAIAEAHLAMQPCNAHVSLSSLEGFSLQRRIKTESGIVMSDAIQPIAPDLFDRMPVDRRVHAIRFRDGKKSVATVVHAVCHPVHEMCMPHVSSEFPGEMCIALERNGNAGIPLFLNGAAGDTNPPTVSMGAEFAHKHGVALAAAINKPDDGNILNTELFAFATSQIQLQIRPGSGITNPGDAIARMSAIRIGDLAILFLPGEPFVAIALELERASPFTHTVVTGFGENNVGYIPTKTAFIEGGYEIGPGKWSYVQEDAADLIIAGAKQLLSGLYNQRKIATAEK